MRKSKPQNSKTAAWGQAAQGRVPRSLCCILKEAGRFSTKGGRGTMNLTFFPSTHHCTCSFTRDVWRVTGNC